VALCWLLTVALCVSPLASARAELIRSDQALESGRTTGQQAPPAQLRRNLVAQLEAAGVPGNIASARVDALTDGEIVALSGDVADAPAGGYAGAIIAAVVIVAVVYIAIVLLVTQVVRERKQESGSTS
jgi:hypothetical protein